MSLTDLNGKETITVYQVELERAALLKQMLAKDFDLEEKIRLAYELPVELQTRADNARKAISDNQALVAEQKKDLQEINDKLTALDEQKKSLDLILSDIDGKNRALDTANKKLKNDQNDLFEAQNTLKEGQKKLSDEKEINRLFAISLQQKESQIEDYESSLKAREEKLKEIIGG